MISNKPLIRAAVSIIFGAIISVAATPAFATYLTNSDGDTFWHTERPFVSPPVPEERGRHVGSVDMAQTTVGTTPKIGSTDTKPLPADAGRFTAVLLDILKYDVVGDIAAGRAEIAACPEVPSPVALLQGRELTLNLV